VEIVPSALIDTRELEQNNAQTAADAAASDEKPAERRARSRATYLSLRKICLC
jgi:hypothetical protein